mmetsp:Transcript_20315/g.51446  ORF Transcript_20315/g.51446 Transcript_20315/m.51446 type:complete len:146 (-) Transcript_20315:301-738(-)|eukprot:CAMPEP_0202869742 /NCGR_PEP_ID=MMETSP1391-20130828/12620_1 /ASSEMBLY_ACC=CAM_ASM_000867 /TAXON_ID=1034604 /ORGANISM="Chlamydomonas leiostraca, Strain SAG 11-49" /LENGTH=145 /DNA_ID=CAMNT_0049550091 /DNA_START=173 /DNA_END=610 /DNA_ORIENTATION=+
MRLKFVLKPPLITPDDCTEIQAKQLELCAKLYDGTERPVEVVLQGDGEDEESQLMFLEVHDVVDADSGEVLYDAYLYMVDSGSIFKHGTLEEVAMVIQFGLECDDEELGQALEEAMANRTRLTQAATTSPGQDGGEDDEGKANEQ